MGLGGFGGEDSEEVAWGGVEAWRLGGEERLGGEARRFQE
jgi:hypothetical protein